MQCGNNRGGQTGAASATLRWLYNECQQYHIFSTCACARIQKQRDVQTEARLCFNVKLVCQGSVASMTDTDKNKKSKWHKPDTLITILGIRFPT